MRIPRIVKTRRFILSLASALLFFIAVPLPVAILLAPSYLVIIYYILKSKVVFISPYHIEELYHQRYPSVTTKSVHIPFTSVAYGDYARDFVIVEYSTGKARALLPYPKKEKFEPKTIFD